jgi:hypothetical protein
MATESIGQVIKFDDEMAERFIAAAEHAEANPPKPRTHKIKWGDPKETMRGLERKYSGDKNA